MQVIKPMTLGLGTRCVEFKRRLGMCISATLYFPFRPAGEGAVWTDVSMWKFLAAQMPEGALIDEGVVKVQAEYLVHGYAHPPGGPAPACEVVARVAGREKRLHAYGRRLWQDDRTAGPAEPFTQLPLDWRHTYGGEGFAANPLGLGHGKPAAPDAPRLLPQVLRPKANPLNAGEELEPVCLRAIDCSWPQRAQRAGTYDDAWMKTQMPGFASDIDWRYFNLAQSDQWFDAPLRGDEPFEFVNMHPSKPTVGGALPGQVVRCFVDRGGPGGSSEPELREVPMRLTTLWFFPHAERGVAIFQGLAECAEDDGTDVRTLVGAVERLGQPRSAQHYLDAVLRRRDPTHGALHALRQSDLTPEGGSAPDPDFDATQADYKAEGLAGQAQRRGAMFRAQLAIDQARAAGADPAALPLKLPDPEPVPTLEELPDYLIKKQAEVANAQVNALLDAIEQRQAALAKAAAAGIDPASLVPRGPPGYRAAAHLQQLQAAVAGAAQPVAFDAAAVAPKLMQVEASQRAAYLAGAHEQAPAKRLPPERAAAMRAGVQRMLADGKSFFGQDLTGADLSGLDLAGADFTGAWLESANLKGTNLKGAGFAFAVLAHADLSESDASGADFTGANLGRSTLTGLRLVDATLNNAVLSHTALAQTDLRRARIDALKLDGSTWGLADWRLVQGSQLFFHKLTLAEAVFQRCQLASPVFVECDLSGVDFTGARLQSATFIKCKAVGVRMADAVIEGAVFVDGCDFSGADFSRARMNRCNLRGTRLAGAVFEGALLDDADLSEAQADGANLHQASLRNALLIKTRLQGARLDGANLMNAIAQRADLRGADLMRANLYGSDLSRIWLDAGSVLAGANVDRAKSYPRREASA